MYIPSELSLMYVRGKSCRMQISSKSPNNPMMAHPPVVLDGSKRIPPYKNSALMIPQKIHRGFHV